jgi:hypothetical protein
MVPMTDLIRDELKWWTVRENLDKGVVFPKPPHQMVLTTDASKTGWGGHIETFEVKGEWTLEESHLHINLLELWAVHRALIMLGHVIFNKRLLVKSDNSTVVYYINKQGGTRFPTLCLHTMKLITWCIKHAVILQVIHIPGMDNVQADNLSRGVSTNPTEWALNRQIFLKLTLLRTFPTIDLFASRKNKQLPVYCSWKKDNEALVCDALSMSWMGMFAYAFPPISLIPKTLEKIIREECLVPLITPRWPRQHWFQNLIEMSVDWPIMLPHEDHNLLRMPGTNARFHDTMNLQLTAWTLSNSVTRRKDFLRKLPTWLPEEEGTQRSELILRVSDHSLSGANSEIDPNSAPIKDVAQFLTIKFNQGIQASTVRGYLTAIQSIHRGCKDGSVIRNNQSLKYLIEGMAITRPRVRNIWPSWDLPTVLEKIERYSL